MSGEQIPHELTPRGEVSPGLILLLDSMRSIGAPFNAAVYPAGTDVSYLALVDNGVGWQAVCETRNGKTGAWAYDLWFSAPGRPLRMKKNNLTVNEAARFLVDQYTNAKLARVMARPARRAD